MIGSQPQASFKVWARARLRLPRSWIVALCALALAGCGAAADPERAIALQGWQARPVGHYLLRTREVVGPLTCGQVVEIRDEALVNIVSNTCQQPSLWTVSWLFAYVEKARQAVDRCTLAVPGAGCVCRDAVDVQVEYDPALGYWTYLARHLAPPNCTPPFTDPGRVVLVRELRPLP